MIVGVNGLMGSGKDTVGQIIQYLTSTCSRQDSEVYRTFAEFLEKRERPDDHYYSDWEIKKFAEKLKQICALLIGCRVEDFESQEFKKSNLPPEWDRWIMYNKSDPESILSISDNEESLLHSIGSSKEEYSKIQSPEIIIIKSPITVRRFLQEVGTEAFRDIIHPNTWVNSLFSDYKLEHHSVNYGTVTDSRGIIHRIPISNNSMYPNWIITDLRFPNEFKAIEGKDGITINIVRNNCVSSNHISETALNNHQFKYTIENNSTIEELVERVRSILKIEKIIV